MSISASLGRLLKQRGLRVQNLYYFALFPLMGFNTAYWTGNLVKRAQGKDGGRALPESVRRTVDLAFVRPAVTLVVAALLLFSVCLQRGVTDARPQHHRIG